MGTMLNKAIQWRLLNDNPMKDVVRYKGDEVDNQRVRYLEKAELDRLLHCCQEPKLRNIVALALHTGMRKGEIQRLQWNHVDFQKTAALGRNQQKWNEEIYSVG